MTAAPLEAYDSEQLRQLLNVYRDAEVAIMQQIANTVSRGADVPHWQEQKLLELQAMQADIRQRLQGVVPRSLRLIRESMEVAYNRGDFEALAELSREDSQRRLTMGTMARSTSLEHLIRTTQQSMIGSHLMVLRSTEDIYRRVIQHASLLEAAGVMTRRQAAQVALDRFAASGVSAFKDGAGRNWSLSSYTEMAMRTATHRASVEGKLDVWRDRGKDLVYVSDHGQECALCRPWEGKVLSIGSSNNPLAVATLEAAQAAGLMHPGCRHTVGLYIDGLSIPKGTPDPQGDADRQKLRSMERTVRKWRARKAVAVTPQATELANAKIKAWTAQIKDHTSTTSAKRQPFRESIITQAR